MDASMGDFHQFVDKMDYQDTGEVQYVYDESQMVLAGPNGFNNITDLVLEDGTRAMIVNGTLVTADGQTLILQDGSDLSQYYIDENTDHILLSQEQEEQFLEIISSQNPHAEEQAVVQYVQDNDCIPHVQEENGQQFLYIQEDNQVLPVQQERYQLNEAGPENSVVPMQVIKLENEQVLDGINGVIDLEQFLNQQGMVLEGANYQYAVLKDGKFHIQTVNEQPSPEPLQIPCGSNVKAQPVLKPHQDYTNLDLSEIKGKDMTTGEPISLSKYMEKVYRKDYHKKEPNIYKKDSSIHNKVKYQEKFKSHNASKNMTHDLKKLINRKITIGKTDSGKLLVGKIINVTKKTEASTHCFSNNKARLEKNIRSKKVPSPSKEKARNMPPKEIINLVENEERTSNSREERNLLLENPRTKTRESNLKMTDDQNNEDNLITITSSNSNSPRRTSEAGSSILRPTLESSVSSTTNNPSEPDNQTQSPVITTTTLSPEKQNENSSNPLEDNEDNNDNPVAHTTSVEVLPDQSKILVHKKVVPKDCFEVITRTLTGLMCMESVVKKLKYKTIIIKIVEKTYDHDLGIYSKSISYCTGYMVREYKLNEEANSFSQTWKFIPDTNSQDTILGEDNLETILQERTEGQVNLKKIANLTIQITINPQGNRSTRVIINPPNMYKCKDCNKSFRTNSALKVHITECHSPPRAECTTCSVQFANTQEVKEHYLVHEVDNDNGMYECMECNKRFGTSLLLRKHMEIHFKPVQCRLCDQRFSNWRELKTHLPIHGSVTSQSPESPDVGKELPQDKALGYSKPEKQIYCCHICGRQFSRHSNLQRHIEIHQGEGAMYKCAICNCSYHYVSSLTRHVVTCHVNTKNKQSQNVEKPRRPPETASNTELQFLQEDQIVEMIRLEDMGVENMPYNVTQSLNIVGEGGVQVLQIPVDEVVVED